MRILFNLIFLLTFNLSFADPIVSNYTKYKKTNSLIKLEKLDVSFIHPWAISIIDDHNVIVSEKGGGLFTFDLINLIKLF
jgi:hypothetical protein